MWQPNAMSDPHLDFWTASAAIAPVLGLTHSVLTSALYTATSRLYHVLGPNLSENAEAIKLRNKLALFSNISMGSVAACIVAMAWALVSLGFASDFAAVRIFVILALSVAMVTSLVLGVLTAREAPKFAQFSVEVPESR